MSLREKVENIFRDRIEKRQKRSTNESCGEYVREALPFKGSNLYARWVYPYIAEEPPMYVVFSFRDDWPLYIWEPVERTWFQNVEGYSPTTSQHSSDANPGYDTLPLDTDTMLDIMNRGARVVLKQITKDERLS
jgi:hypothetical protein